MEKETETARTSPSPKKKKNPSEYGGNGKTEKEEVKSGLSARWK